MDVPNFEDSSAHHVDPFPRYVERMDFFGHIAAIRIQLLRTVVLYCSVAAYPVMSRSHNSGSVKPSYHS
jgi:hypothetical protein